MKTTCNRLCAACLRAISALSIILFVLLTSSIAFADDGQTALGNLSTELMNVLVPVFVTFIGAFATWLLHKVQKRFHIAVSEQTAVAWENLARKAALRGGEWARKKAKSLTDGKKIPGNEVMEVAANWAIEMAKQQKIPAMAREKLEGLIEAKLFEIRRDEVAMATAAGNPPTDHGAAI